MMNGMKQLPTRRQLLLGMAGIWGAGLTGTAAAASLPLAAALPEELARALSRRQPLVVMVSLDGCPACRAARDGHLVHLHQQDVPIVQVDMLSRRSLRDLKDHVVTHDAQVRAWGIKIAPTVLFLGPGGREIADRLIGSYLPDFYATYLEERLRQARAVLR